MAAAIGLLIVICGGGVVAHLYWNLRAQRISNLRLAAGFQEERLGAAPPPELKKPRRFARRHYILPWLGAIALVLIGREVYPIPWSFSAAFGLLIGLLLGQFDAMLLARARSRIENQLADAIDLMIGSLKVGAGLQASLENAMQESRAPLRSQLEEVVGRIRLGDDPRTAVAGLAERVPLEAFQLFATVLSVHWDVGGSLTETLATVGRVIRDRIEISQRLQALTTQAQASIVAVLVVTYFIAALMWRNNPSRMGQFLASDTGQWMVAISIILEGVGIVWVSRLRNVRY